MKISLKTLRPAGNPILRTKNPLNYNHFANTNVEFYQSGTAALAAALIATKKLSSDSAECPEVLLPAYACPDLISACLYAGVTPKLVDLEPQSCWMSLEQIKQSITERTIAIIAVRFLGIAERMAQLRTICEDCNLILIEDSAQGFPTINPKTYWQGDLSILSFGRGKPVNMLAGGAVLTSNTEIKQLLPLRTVTTDSGTNSMKYRIKVQLYNFLIHPFIYGMATKLPGLKVGETIFKPLNTILGIPMDVAVRLNDNIVSYKNLPNISAEINSRLNSLKISELIDLPAESRHDFADPLLRYPLLVMNTEKRNKLYLALRAFGASLMYQKPLYRINGIPPETFPSLTNMANAEAFSQQLITLPTHTGATAKVIDRIFEVTRKILL
jgi:dTDP-4-amino-4,6-dideoxygalactose transaminase